VAGQGLQGTAANGELVKLGSSRWCGVLTGAPAEDATLEIFLKVGIREPVALRFTDVLRPDAHETIRALRQRGIDAEILSGDREETVESVAEDLGILRHRAAQMPHEKLAYIQKLASEGLRVLVVGDGINDAPALAAGLTSMAPSSGSDVGRTAADFVFTGDSLWPVVDAIDVARRTSRMVKQNFILAIAYNAIAVPIAVLGLVTPLIAALAMSSSSMIVTGNALRLRLMRFSRARTAVEAKRDEASAAPVRHTEEAA
jgi:Cu2+-exporting ATPase